ncbi:uncharacterized protein FMAN_14540 [Fusarium mangiferae]|uniref:Protein kinase domain-containing protein n=1 Tax=Fusarium mangiferae TaxID=192010 RepID=A0A1L7UH24_FUSMA|nr:uncharacterized protein FMAN_14540 [Fusarium mangiferae]CVL07663.1 uncharacterized protein FMAN_14540 [Fusarium mangiferae]
MAELALAIAGVAGTVDVCIKLGKYLIQAYKDYGQVDKLADEVSVRIQICWSRIASQLEIIKELESGMTEDQRELQSHILRILQSKLETATVVISKPDKHGSSKRYKALHFLNLRETLESTVADLESWQKRFEPSWFQIIKTGPANTENVLKSVTRTSTRGGGEPAREGLKFREAFNNSETVKLAEKVLENLVTQAIPYFALRDARELASRLRDSDPSTFGTLKCKGVVQVTKAPLLKFVFSVPEGYTRVRSCRELLLSGIVPDSLTTRLNIARQLVTAVYYVHLYEFVHKNITPEKILILECPSKEKECMLVCLAGFQLFRYADSPTNSSKAEKRSAVYQHPTRTGGKTVKYVMHHDIYSLGVCLLEIGLWRSLVEYDGATTSLSPVFPNSRGCLSELDSQAIKEQLMLLSRTELRMCMGDIYSTVVETCLTCLDEGNTGFGDPQDFDNGGGVEVGSQYVESIMDRMGALCF